MESARMMGILWTGAADAGIGCWNAKFTYNFWRPVTSIRVGGGNPNLVTDADWTPLGITPSHPEYPAAHGCFTGAVSSLIRGYFRTRKVHIVVESRSEEHTSELQSHLNLVCRLLLEKKKKK